MQNSYEHSYQHDLDNVIDVSDVVLAIGTEKIDTNTLKDRSLTGNDATIHGAMPSSGYFLGRRFTAANENCLDCGNDNSLDTPKTIYVLIKQSSAVDAYIQFKGSAYRLKIQDGANIRGIIYVGSNLKDTQDSMSGIGTNVFVLVGLTYDGTTVRLHRNGVEVTSYSKQYSGGGAIDATVDDNIIGCSISIFIDSIIYLTVISNNIENMGDIFNTLAVLPLYSHNFTQYPNSDTSLTSVFPYTSGIITSGAFNKTDGLKCTSAGTIVFSNNFEFDGSEYLTLTIDGVEYSGTTTVTQGTVTATIAQSSNDITIDMGTNDVLEDIQIQFRSEV